MTTFFDDVVTHAAQSESPREFLPWIPLCTVSSILRGKVHVNRQVYNVYPNLYVLITGPSGIIKGYTTTLTKSLVKLIDNTRVFSGRFSIQAFITKLSKMEERENGNHIKDASAAIISGEFSASVVDDPMAMTILTDLYDTAYNSEWTNSLKSSGDEVLKNPCITLMGASNEEHFNIMMSGREIRGGFIGRCLLVYSNVPGPKNDFLDPIEGFDGNLTRFKPFLHDVAQLSGEIILDECAKTEYRNWYKDFHIAQIEDKTGGISRLKDKIMKVALNLAVCKRLEKRIIADDIIHAKHICIDSQVKLDKLTKGSGSAVDSNKTRMVLQMLIGAGGGEINRSEILSALTGDIDYLDLDKIMTTLNQAGSIEIRAANTTYYYRMKENVIEALEKRLGGIRQ